MGRAQGRAIVAWSLDRRGKSSIIAAIYARKSTDQNLAERLSS
jgi:hypothetical protein